MIGAAAAVLLACVEIVGVDWAPIVEIAFKQVPRIEIQHAGTTDGGVCSGVVVNKEDGYVLTAAHCFKGKEDSITVNGRDAELVKWNTILDLAVLKTKVKGSAQQMLLADTTPKAGSEVAIIGFNFGVKQIAVQFGRISQTYNDNTDTVWIDGVIVKGQSGGACIDERGKLIGMTSGRFSDGGSNIGGAIPVEKIQDFIEKYLPKPKQ